MKSKNQNTKALSLKGKKIGDVICQSFHLAGDVIIIWGSNGESRVFETEGIINKPKVYQINGEPIKEVFIPSQHELLIFITKEKEYFRNFNNEAIQEANYWNDYYFEPFTSSFYRQDKRGNWYDIEGFRLGGKVFLKEDVLCSLPGKISKKSIAFSGQRILISPHGNLIQIGKMVYDINLEPVHYFGEKITGLGKKNISFGGNDVLQEIHLGLCNIAFINEYTKEPYLANTEEIIAHVKTAILNDRHRFEIFRSKNHEYVVEKNSNRIFSYDGVPVSIRLSTYISIGGHELVLAKKGKEKLYIDINSRKPFLLPSLGNTRVIDIDPQMILVNEDELYNIKTSEGEVVYNATKHQLFTLEEGNLVPEILSKVEGFENYFTLAKLNGKFQLFHNRLNELIRLGPDDLKVVEVKSTVDQKLLNAISNDGEPIVIDARRGFDQLQLASIGKQRVVKVFGNAHRIGTAVLQNASLKTLGDVEPRVIDIDNEELQIFTLPEDLKEYPGQEAPSGFQTNPILHLDFKKPIEIDEYKFLKGTFLDYMGKTHDIILQHSNGRPLHFDGAIHRNELATGFIDDTIKNEYHIGTHRMIGITTLTEDFKERELVFSLHKMISWLPFAEQYLPILKRVIVLKDEADWEYVLFEIREIAGTNKEYLVMEDKPPFRILVDQKRKKLTPRIVKSKKKLLKSPKEVSRLRRFFLKDPGYLVEME